MAHTILIGIDDTDVIDSSGTGRMARDLADHLCGLGLGRPLGVTRHQLLVDERIPYTSHNSSLCIALETEAEPERFSQPSADFLREHFREGSDPGLCICLADDVPAAVQQFGLRAGREVLEKAEAIGLAADNGIFLVELGGTGGGIIGALAGVGLRAEGNSGRFIDLPGIRDIFGVLSVNDILKRTDVQAVIGTDDAPLADTESIDTRDWLRPSLVAGRPALRVRQVSSPGESVIWTSVELREREKRQQQEESS